MGDVIRDTDNGQRYIAEKLVLGDGYPHNVQELYALVWITTDLLRRIEQQNDVIFWVQEGHDKVRVTDLVARCLGTFDAHLPDDHTRLLVPSGGHI